MFAWEPMGRDEVKLGQEGIAHALAVGTGGAMVAATAGSVVGRAIEPGEADLEQVRVVRVRPPGGEPETGGRVVVVDAAAAPASCSPAKLRPATSVRSRSSAGGPARSGC